MSKPLTIILASQDGPYENQIADIIADLTTRRFRPEQIQTPGDYDGYVYVGSEYYGTVSRTAMSDRIRFTYDRGMNEIGRGTSRAVSRRLRYHH